MSVALIIGGLLLAIAVLVILISPRRRNRANAENNWKNEAYSARERTGSWVENETWVGHDDDDPSSSFPGIR